MTQSQVFPGEVLFIKRAVGFQILLKAATSID